MAAPYDPKSISNLFVTRSLHEGRPIDHMKLQKLVYFSHGYYLAASKLNTGAPQPLINEFFEAWPYGPVCPSVYQAFKEYGKGPILRPALGYDPSFGAFVLVPPPEDDELLKSVSGYVWSQFSDKPSMHLSDITHRVDGAWDRARKDAHGIRGKSVPNEYILDDFAALVKKSDG